MKGDPFWQELDFWGPWRKVLAVAFSASTVITAFFASVMWKWGFDPIRAIAVAAGLDLLFCGSVLILEYVEFRTTARAIGHDEGAIYFTWRGSSGNPVEIPLSNVMKIEIADSPRGGIGIFLPDGTEVQAYPGLALKSPFVQSLLEAWGRSLALRGQTLA